MDLIVVAGIATNIAYTSVACDARAKYMQLLLCPHECCWCTSGLIMLIGAYQIYGSLCRDPWGKIRHQNCHHGADQINEADVEISGCCGPLAQEGQDCSRQDPTRARAMKPE